MITIPKMGREHEKPEKEIRNLRIQYQRPGFEIIHPDKIRQRVLKFAAQSGEHFDVFKISPDIVVKVGDSRIWDEAKNMLYVEQNSTIPVQKVYAVYSCSRTLWYDGAPDQMLQTMFHYLVMELKPGVKVDTAWSTWDKATMANVANELKDYVNQLRNMPGGGYIGRLDRLPLEEPFGRFGPFGPFESEEAFNSALAERYESPGKIYAFRGRTRERIEGALGVHKHKIAFTHQRLQPGNILVHDGHISAILNWNDAAWLPDYIEYHFARLRSYSRRDWATIVDDAFGPTLPHCESRLYRDLRLHKEQSATNRRSNWVL